MSGPEVVVIGAGAAGIAAGLRLRRAGVAFVVLEARDRIGGRAHTVVRERLPLDLGCGWLHDAEANSWRDLFQRLGLDMDATPGPWAAPALTANFPAKDQTAYHRAFAAMERRLAQAAEGPRDRAAGELLEPGGRWNGLLDAFSAAYNGEPFARISVKDYATYEEGRTNHRLVQGYGAAIAYAGRDLPVRIGAAVRRIEHGGGRLRVELADGGALEARAAIVTLPSDLLAAEAIAFDPPLPDKLQAAADLPLGLADKVFLHLDDADGFAPESFLHGATDTARTMAHHIRPLGRPVIESYFGGDTARELEGEAAVAFAIDEVAAALGSDMRRRLRPLAATRWAADPWSRGAYSHARVGCIGARTRLAEPVDGRLFFAGEACSPRWFSTAHGAYETGVAAAEGVLEALAASA